MSQKVLIIDDSQAIRTLVTTHLREECLEISSAPNAAEGLAAAQNLQPDLILLDVDMPDADGFTVCRQLKSNQNTLAIPIIFLTGATSAKEKIRGLDMGAVDYVTKPFDAAELRARVRASLRTKYLVDLLSRKAMIDGLTGLWNRGYFDQRLATEMSLAKRTGLPLSCIMADLDHFKEINDTYGHRFGDQVLMTVANVLSDACRKEDIVCRYGGEEFVVLAPNTCGTGAGILAERMRHAISERSLNYRGAIVQVSCSFGVADLGGMLPPSVVELADEALYEAKRNGRNRVFMNDIVNQQIRQFHDTSATQPLAEPSAAAE